MSSTPGSSEAVRIECAAEPPFQNWLAQCGGSVAVSTYQAGKVAMIGWDGRQVTLLMRQFDKPLGMAVVANRMVLATRHDLWVFANSPILAYEYLEEQPGRYDTLFLPRATYYIGDVHAHDVAISGERIVFVATRFSCLATIGFDYSFTPLWKPRFISDLVPEDRCHLNGLAMLDGRPKYVTAMGTTDTAGGWRQEKAGGGVLIDVDSGEVVLGGLSMPHSPRLHAGRIWLLNSGAGQLTTVDPKSGAAELVCELPGYTRGLSLVGDYALIGLSKIREKHIFGGLPVQERCESLRCGVAVVHLPSGGLVGIFDFTAGCEELYDVQFLPRIFRPMILNLDKPAVWQAITYKEASFWLRPSHEIRDEAAGQAPPGMATQITLPPLGWNAQNYTREHRIPPQQGE
jgi:uncharacterized protein (TIGR03032 family)